MNELIKVNTETETPTVSGRELHEFLEVETPYRLWFPRMCEYGFTEKVDYTPDKFVHPQNLQETIDHSLNLDMAKELCMIQRSEKGKIARKYFLEIEKRWNDPIITMARALKFADKRIIELSSKISSDAPKVAFADALSASNSTILIRDFVKILHQNGMDTGEKRFYEYLRNNGYLMQYGASHNKPTQKAMDLELFELNANAIACASGEVITRYTSKLTPKGQRYFIDRLIPKSELCETV